MFVVVCSGLTLLSTVLQSYQIRLHYSLFKFKDNYSNFFRCPVSGFNSTHQEAVVWPEDECFQLRQLFEIRSQRVRNGVAIQLKLFQSETDFTVSLS